VALRRRKWLIDAPYILEAGKSCRSIQARLSRPTTPTEALANLIHPFWMLPLPGILGLKPRDIGRLFHGSCLSCTSRSCYSGLDPELHAATVGVE